MRPRSRASGARGIALGAALACAAASGSAMKTIDRGTRSQVDAARQVVVRTAGEWERLWAEHAGGRARPAVDFAREMVVAVFLGRRPTAGYSVAIVDVRSGADATIVEYRETRPGPGTVVAQILTSPYAIVAVPKAAGEVRFEQAKE